MKNTLVKNICIFTVIFFVQAFGVNAQVTFEEVLKNPNDLKLNLKYAKEQEDLGNFKSVISTLERLTSLYPENIDLKMYYLSISLRIDSVERTIQIIDEIKNSEQLTAEINAEIDIILQNLDNTANANENKWNGYIDISLNHTYHTNINNLSDSGTFYVSDSISNYATNEIENDTLQIPSIRIGGFKKLSDNIKDDGIIGMQLISIKDDLYSSYKYNADFIQKYIFPGGFLPSIHALQRVTTECGLNMNVEKTFGKDYANTLSIWRKSFLNNWNVISKEKIFDVKFKNMWEYYLAYCEAGFLSGSTNVHQITLKK